MQLWSGLLWTLGWRWLAARQEVGCLRWQLQCSGGWWRLVGGGQGWRWVEARQEACAACACGVPAAGGCWGGLAGAWAGLGSRRMRLKWQGRRQQPGLTATALPTPSAHTSAGVGVDWFGVAFFGVLAAVVGGNILKAVRRKREYGACRRALAKIKRVGGSARWRWRGAGEEGGGHCSQGLQRKRCRLPAGPGQDQVGGWRGWSSGG